MKKLSLCISMILALSMLAFCLTGCDENSEVTTFASEESSATAETSKDTLIATNPEESSSEEETTKAAEPAKMVGTYKSGDGSTVIVSENGGTYKANISIYKLMNVTLSGSISGDTISLSGPDPDGGKFAAEITESGSGITLKFTSSTWDYVRTGETFNFSK